MTHICINKIIIIGSDNGLLPGRLQSIIWTNDWILLIGPLRTNFSEIWIQINTFSFTKMHLKMSRKCQPYCLGLNVLSTAMTKGEHKSSISLTKDTPYLALTGELWGDYCENFGESWMRYNGIVLHITGPLYGEVASEAASPHKSVAMLSIDFITEMHQNNQLTYLVLKPKYFMQSRSILWLLIPWLFVLPGHQQPWYWICRINGSLSSTRKDFNYLCHIRIVKWFQFTKLIKLTAFLRQPQCVNWWSWLFSYL